MQLRATHTLLILTLGFLSWGATSAIAQASPELVDRIVAVVDEEAILLSDLEREIESYGFERQSAGETSPVDAAEVREQMLDRLIEVKLLVAQAQMEGIEVAEEEVQREVDLNLKQLEERFGGRAALEGELARNGMSYGDLKERNLELVRNRMYTARMVNQYVRPKVEVREEQIRAYFDEHQNDIPPKPGQVQLANILVVPQPADAARVALESKMAEIDAMLGQGPNFDAVAKAHSEGPNAARGGLLGSFARGDLFSPIIEEAAFTIPVGEVSAPLYTELGVHRILVSERSEDEVTLSQIFLRIQLGEAEREEARQRSLDVARRARDGEDFAALAEEFSDDPTSRANGGLLGSFSDQELSPQFQGAIRGLEAGGVSEPVAGSAGFFILKVISREGGGAYEFEEVREQLRRMVEDESVQAELQRYLIELRKRFHIERKA